MAEQPLSRESVLQERAAVHSAPRVPWRRLLSRKALAALLLVLMMPATVALTRAAARPAVMVTMQVNGATEPFLTREPTVGALLRTLGYALAPQDIVYPPPQTALSPTEPVTVILARDMTLVVDERYRRVLSHAERVGDFLLEQGVMIGPLDAILLNGRPVSPDALLPMLVSDAERPRGTLTVERAIPFSVEADGVALAFSTRARTVGAALLEQGITVYEGESVTPPLGARLTPGMAVQLWRANPVRLAADGREIWTRTRAETVGELLAQQGITVRALDLLSLPTDTPFRAEHHRLSRSLGPPASRGPHASEHGAPCW